MAEEMNRPLVELTDCNVDGDDLNPEEVAKLVAGDQMLMLVYLQPKQRAGVSEIGVDHPKWLIESWKKDPVRALAIIRLLRMHASNLELQFALATGERKQ